MQFEQSEIPQLSVWKKQVLFTNETKNMQSSLKLDILILLIFQFLATAIFSFLF